MLRWRAREGPVVLLAIARWGERSVLGRLGQVPAVQRGRFVGPPPQA